MGMTNALRSEIRQTKPFTSPEEEVYLNLLRTAGLLEHALADGLKPFGVTPTQYNVLRILRGAGESGLCRNEVRARMLTPVPDATRLLDRLADMGLVVRVRDGVDRRFVTTRITVKGLELLGSIDEPLRALHTQQLGHLPEVDLRRLAVLLARARKREGK